VAYIALPLCGEIRHIDPSGICPPIFGVGTSIPNNFLIVFSSPRHAMISETCAYAG
jgi:hypothetical protein